MHAMGKDKGENERGEFGVLVVLVPMEVKEVKNFLLVKKKHLNALEPGAVESSFPRIYEISCISPTLPVKNKHWWN